MNQPENENNTTTDSSNPKWADQQYLVHFLKDNESQCPRCSYNLYQLTGDRCPECGTMLCLTVGATEPFLRAWILLIAGLCVGAGLGVFWILLLLAEGPPRRPGVVISIACSIVCMPLAIVSALCRKPFLRLSTNAQWALATMGTSLAGVAYIALTVALG